MAAGPPAAATLPRRAVKGVLRSSYPYSLAFLTGRHELAHLLNRRGLLGTGVEVGVDKGLFSEQILESWEGRLLISVDSWVAVPDGAERQAEQERRCKMATERLGAFGERSEIRRQESTEAAAAVDPRSLDFVYIDAAHEYESVSADIEAWFGCVRSGGILSGHDYWDGPWMGGIYGVRTAVQEFCSKHELRVSTTRRERPQGRSWLVEVP